MSKGVQPPVFDDTSESISLCVRPPMKRCELIKKKTFQLIDLLMTQNIENKINRDHWEYQTSNQRRKQSVRSIDRFKESASTRQCSGRDREVVSRASTWVLSYWAHSQATRRDHPEKMPKGNSSTSQLYLNGSFHLTNGLQRYKNESFFNRSSNLNHSPN